MCNFFIFEDRAFVVSYELYRQSKNNVSYHVQIFDSANFRKVMTISNLQSEISPKGGFLEFTSG